jgi:ppGpp synthetase/RelA/SpoT-type nucleotidyltranferase
MPQLSNRQIDRLGDRLRRSDPTAEDLELLGQVGELYAGALAEVLGVLTDLGLEPGGRLKTVGTLVDKLRRIPEPLSRIQDVAGARVVAEMNREEQDRLVRLITDRFDHYRVKDRRVEPSYGYRAVHIIVRVQGRPVEIQVRTHLQDLWAQIVERVADVWGRQIRYGGLPSQPDRRLGNTTRRGFLEWMMNFASQIDSVEQAAKIRAQLDRLNEELKAHGQEVPDTAEAETAALYALWDERERRVWALLEHLHDATRPRTLGP